MRIIPGASGHKCVRAMGSPDAGVYRYTSAGALQPCSAVIETFY